MDIKEFKAKILIRVLHKLSKGGVIQEVNDYITIQRNLVFAVNEILRENGYTDVWAKQRGRRIFIFYAPLRRIVCEVGIDANYSETISNFDIQLVNLKGIIVNKTLQDLINDIKKLGVRNAK